MEGENRTRKDLIAKISPNDKSVLKETFANANLTAEIEVYAGAAHGWCPPDSRVYNEPQAEKAWSRLFRAFLAGSKAQRTLTRAATAIG